MITSIVRAEHKGADTCYGGFVAMVDASPILVRWHQQAPIEPVRDAAKQYAANLADFLLAQGQDASSVNWASVVACIDRIIREWNDARRASLHSERESQVVH